MYWYVSCKYKLYFNILTSHTRKACTILNDIWYCMVEGGNTMGACLCRFGNK